MRILVVSALAPYLPCHDGGRAPVAHLLRELAAHHALGLVAASAPEDTPAQLGWAGPLVEWLEVVPGPPPAPAANGAGGSLADHLRPAVQRALTRFVPDALYLEGCGLAPLGRLGGRPTLLSMRRPPVPGRQRAATPPASLAARWLAGRSRAWEQRWLGAADLCVVTSEDDRARLRALAPGRVVEVIPPGIDLKQCEFRGWRRPGRIAVTVDFARRGAARAVRRFAARVLPAVRARVPEAELVVAGLAPPPRVRALDRRPGVQAGPGVHDLRPTLWRATVHVTPPGSRSVGHGLLEAMAVGTPVVLGAEVHAELPELLPARHCLVADDEQALAEAVAAVLTDPALAAGLAARARELVERRFAWPALAGRYAALLSRYRRPVPAARAA